MLFVLCQASAIKHFSELHVSMLTVAFASKCCSSAQPHRAASLALDF